MSAEKEISKIQTVPVETSQDSKTDNHEVLLDMPVRAEDHLDFINALPVKDDVRKQILKDMLDAAQAHNVAEKPE